MSPPSSLRFPSRVFAFVSIPLFPSQKAHYQHYPLFPPSFRPSLFYTPSLLPIPDHTKGERRNHPLFSPYLRMRRCSEGKKGRGGIIAPHWFDAHCEV